MDEKNDLSTPEDYLGILVSVLSIDLLLSKKSETKVRLCDII